MVSVGCRLSPRSYLSPHILVSVDLQDLTLASLETSTFLLQAAINKNAYLDCFLSAQEVEKVMSSFIYHPPVRNNVRHSISIAQLSPSCFVQVTKIRFYFQLVRDSVNMFMDDWRLFMTRNMNIYGAKIMLDTYVVDTKRTKNILTTTVLIDVFNTHLMDPSTTPTL